MEPHHILRPMPQPLLVTDGPHLLYRAFYALPDTITDDDGMPVNALLGSANQTLWCVEKYSPRAVVFCFGAEAADYRVEAYPDYHADRPPVPDKLDPQWERAEDFYRAFGWTRGVRRGSRGGRPPALAGRRREPRQAGTR